ncbi:hypothetical protein TNCV_1423041 [Trichonephila clavipes]|nr:hypothetical protein TNCV_1423041 [Trichonephila clavipes]
MPMDFERIATVGTLKCQPNSSVWNAGATARALTSPCIDEPATFSISSLTVSAVFRRVLGRPLRGLSSKTPVASNFEIILATAAFVNGILPLRIPFVWRKERNAALAHSPSDNTAKLTVPFQVTSTCCDCWCN